MGYLYYLMFSLCTSANMIKTKLNQTKLWPKHKVLIRCLSIQITSLLFISQIQTIQQKKNRKFILVFASSNHIVGDIQENNSLWMRFIGHPVWLKMQNKHEIWHLLRRTFYDYPHSMYRGKVNDIFSWDEMGEGTNCGQQHGEIQRGIRRLCFARLGVLRSMVHFGKRQWFDCL